MRETCEGNLDQRDRKKKNQDEGDRHQRWNICHFLLFPQSFWKWEKLYKKDCAISLPTGFIFVHCRLVSQCNAPPITSHSFAPTPHPSRPSAHAPNTLWRQLLLRGGVRFCRPQSTSSLPSLPAPSCLCWLPSPRFISSTQPRTADLPRSLAFLVRICDASENCYSNRVWKKC